jgi:hypothetical protein
VVTVRVRLPFPAPSRAGVAQPVEAATDISGSRSKISIAVAHRIERRRASSARSRVQTPSARPRRAVAQSAEQAPKEMTRILKRADEHKWRRDSPLSGIRDEARGLDMLPGLTSSAADRPGCGAGTTARRRVPPARPGRSNPFPCSDRHAEGSSVRITTLRPLAEVHCRDGAAQPHRPVPAGDTDPSQPWETTGPGRAARDQCADTVQSGSRSIRSLVTPSASSWEPDPGR